ncbi:RNA-binding protein 44 isoform X2 [Mastomys coucha]|uniref:RNA-binding protein 44 isoform X2 n=1 Tax=Mastomys coucha TaxID=35658 RepID=UPI00126253A6|nr:RNA-binding protein 44 isoform X2 [Mastomys coucha]
MQATAAIETDSDKNYHKNGGHFQHDKFYNPKKENILFSNGCIEVELTFSSGEGNSLATEERSHDNENSTVDRKDLSEPSFSETQGANVENDFSQSSEFEDSNDYAFLNETYSIHYSESKLKDENLLHLYSELYPEVEKRVEMFFDTFGPQDTNSIGSSPEASGADCGDMQRSDIDEDSQQEYHSAELECTSAHLVVNPAKTVSRSSLDVSEFKTSSYDFKCGGSFEDNHGSSPSLELRNAFVQECSSQVSTSQSSDMLKEYRELKYEKCKEQEVGLTYHKAFDDILQRSSSPLIHQKVPETLVYTKEIKSQTIESKDFYGNRIFQKKALQHPENAIRFPQDKALETHLKADDTHQPSWPCVLNDSIISLSASLEYKSLPEPGFFSPVIPQVAVTDSQAEVEDSGSYHVQGSATNKTCSLMKEMCLKSVSDAASCVAAVQQTLDGSSRASASSSTVSASSNTETKMVRQSQPEEWQSNRQSVACNTDWSCGQQYRDAQTAAPGSDSGRPLSAEGHLQPTGNSLNENTLELRKTFDTTDRQKYPERAFQLCEEVAVPPKCCEKTTERAVKAEIHLLDVCYQTCHHHCHHIYKLVMETRAGPNRALPTDCAKRDLGAALLSVLGDLKVRYMNLKGKVHKGIPLEELPPLLVESKLLAAFSDFASRLMKEEACSLSGANSELGNQSLPDVDISPSLLNTLSQMSFISDNSHPKQDKSPMNNVFKSGDINIDFNRLKLNDKDCKTIHEASEDWFDATEKLTGADFSVTQENTTEYEEWELKNPLELKNTEMHRRGKGFLIHVGGLCPSVSEADLRTHFQKYQVSEISICDSSTNYRYATLAFAKNSNAKMAVKEMNGIEINGKSVNVRLVKIPGEYTPPPLSTTGKSTSMNHLEKNTNNTTSAFSACRLPRARSRQLESEQDNEFPLLDQGVKKNCNQMKSGQLLPETPFQFIPPNTLNLRSFTKIMTRLAELHPDISRDHIIEALQEVKLNHKGFLNGLSINTIVKMTSSYLRNSASHLK